VTGDETMRRLSGLEEARRRILRASLAISLVAVDDKSGLPEHAAAYAELSDAARQLVLAQNAWDDWSEATQDERAAWVARAARPPASTP
jgi:hypothetical protein